MPARARPLATALLAVGLLGAAGCTTEEDEPVPVPTISAGPPTTAVATAPTPDPAAVRAVPVYYVADTPVGPRLYREFHQLGTADPGTDAVREMLAGAPADPDYRSPWRAGTALRAPVTAEPGRVTVDLTGIGGTGAKDGPPDPALAVQELVYTVQGARQSVDPVRILVDGQPVERLWGVPTGDPVARKDADDVRSPIQIDAPAEGAAVGEDVLVTGEASVFEASLVWEVERDGVVVQNGSATTGESFTLSPYRFTVHLDHAGRYTVRVSEEDLSDGEGRGSVVDDKTITVG
jgi:hypothetical protein